VRVELHDHDPAWAEQFADLAAGLRAALGPTVLRLHHIGSTSVPGLAAKPIIDLQLTVATFERFDHWRPAIEALGYSWDTDNDDRRKRFFALRSPRRANLHVRRFGCQSQALALLLRDYLRAEPSARGRYEATKRALAQRDWDSIDDYANAKGDTIWTLIREADVWSWGSGWFDPPSDA